MAGAPLQGNRRLLSKRHREGTVPYCERIWNSATIKVVSAFRL